MKKNAIDHGLNLGIKNLKQTSGKLYDFADGSFDAVMAFDVLEHLEDERPVISEFMRVLKPEGRLLLTVPAYQWLWGVQDEISHHFRRYSFKSLSNAFSAFTGFKLERKSYYNTLLFFPIAIIRLASKWFGIKGRSSDFEISAGFVNGWLYSIFNLESKILKFINFSFGVSILMVFKKDDTSI